MSKTQIHHGVQNDLGGALCLTGRGSPGVMHETCDCVWEIQMAEVQQPATGVWYKGRRAFPGTMNIGGESDSWVLARCEQSPCGPSTYRLGSSRVSGESKGRGGLLGALCGNTEAASYCRNSISQCSALCSKIPFPLSFFFNSHSNCTLSNPQPKKIPIGLSLLSSFFQLFVHVV